MNELLIQLAHVRIALLNKENQSNVETAKSLKLIEINQVDGELFAELTDGGELFLREEGLFKGNIYRNFNLKRCIKLSKHYEEASPLSKNSWATKDDLMVITKNHLVPDAVYVLPTGKNRGIKIIDNEIDFSMIESIEQNREKLNIDEMLYIH